MVNYVFQKSRFSVIGTSVTYGSPEKLSIMLSLLCHPLYLVSILVGHTMFLLLNDHFENDLERAW